MKEYMFHVSLVSLPSHLNHHCYQTGCCKHSKNYYLANILFILISYHGIYLLRALQHAALASCLKMGCQKSDKNTANLSLNKVRKFQNVLFLNFLRFDYIQFVIFKPLSYCFHRNNTIWRKGLVYKSSIVESNQVI